MMSEVLVIGTGECGARAALALCELGYDGPVTLGGERHLPYERLFLSKGAMVSEMEPLAAGAQPLVTKRRLHNPGMFLRATLGWLNLKWMGQSFAGVA